MRNSVRFPLLVAVIAVAAPGASADADMPLAPAHFKLIEPISWIVENDRGDPQKSGPCGGSNTDWGTPTYTVNQAVGGSMLHLKLQETVYHPGHYRVALAVNGPHELPADPVATTMDAERGPMSVSAAIQNPAQLPVLADGLFEHSERPAAGTQQAPWEANIPLPNINCDHCVLQVVQFMEQHAFNNPGGYTYHHCAIMKITADRAKPMSTGWPAQRQG